MLYFLIILFPIISYAQNLSYLNVQCKHYCSKKDAMIQGSVLWNNETTIDDQKQFLQLEFISNSSEQLNLDLDLQSESQIHETQYLLSINKIENLKTQKIQIIFECQREEILSFTLQITDTLTQANASIPFRKNCSAVYFDVDKFDFQLSKAGKTTKWDLSKPELIDLNLETYFRIAPPANVTLYISDIKLELEDNENNTLMNRFSTINSQIVNQYVTPEKFLALTPNIACREISDEEVNFYFNITSHKLQDPLIVKFKIKCTSIDKEVDNNQEFPIYIGKSKTSSEIYKAGVTQQDYVAPSKIIPENKNAFQFYIYVKGGDKEKIRQSLFSEKFEITVKTTVDDDDILKIKHQNKLVLKNSDDVKSVLLQFDCLQQGQTDVSVSIQFLYQRNKKITSFSFTKVCGPVAQKTERTILGEVIYYGICIIAMLFGVQTIRLFTNLIKQEATVPPVSIDTSYKKGYHMNEEEQQIEL